MILKSFLNKQEKGKSIQSNFGIYKRDKKIKKNFRFKILEILWKIIYSDGVSNMYKSTLLIRLIRLLYVSDKETGDIKQSIINNQTT